MQDFTKLWFELNEQELSVEKENKGFFIYTLSSNKNIAKIVNLLYTLFLEALLIELCKEAFLVDCSNSFASIHVLKISY